jgi:hypothetical protein
LRRRADHGGTLPADSWKPPDSLFYFEYAILFQKLREFLFMLHPKVDQAVHKLCFPPRLQRDFEAAKRRQLHIDVANSSRSAANPAQQLQQLSLISIVRGQQEVKQCLKTAAGGPKIVNGVAVWVFRESHQISFHPAKNKFAAMQFPRHKKAGANRRVRPKNVSGKATRILTPL